MLLRQTKTARQLRHGNFVSRKRLNRQMQSHGQNKKNVKNPSKFESKSHSGADDRNDETVNHQKVEGLHAGYLESQEKVEENLK